MNWSSFQWAMAIIYWVLRIFKGAEDRKQQRDKRHRELSGSGAVRQPSSGMAAGCVAVARPSLTLSMLLVAPGCTYVGTLRSYAEAVGEFRRRIDDQARRSAGTPDLPPSAILGCLQHRDYQLLGDAWGCLADPGVDELARTHFRRPNHVEETTRNAASNAASMPSSAMLDEQGRANITKRWWALLADLTQMSAEQDSVRRDLAAYLPYVLQLLCQAGCESVVIDPFAGTLVVSAAGTCPLSRDEEEYCRAYMRSLSSYFARVTRMQGVVSERIAELDAHFGACTRAMTARVTLCEPTRRRSAPIALAIIIVLVAFVLCVWASAFLLGNSSLDATRASRSTAPTTTVASSPSDTPMPVPAAASAHSGATDQHDPEQPGSVRPHNGEAESASGESTPTPAAKVPSGAHDDGTLPQTPDSQDVEDEVGAALRVYERCTANRDLEGVVACYADRMERYFALRPATSDQVRRSKAKAFDAFNEQVEITFSDVHVDVTSASRAVVTCQKTWDCRGENRPQFAGSKQTEIIYQRRDGGWQVVSERDLQ